MRTYLSMIYGATFCVMSMPYTTGCEKQHEGHYENSQTVCSTEQLEKDVATAVPEQEIVNSMIAIAPSVISDENSNRVEYIERVCSQIDRIPDSETRCRYFKKLADSALSVHFDTVGDIHMKDEGGRWEVYRRLGLSYVSLERLIDNVQMRMMQNKAAPQEQFEPMFRYYEKMREEAVRTAQKENRGYPRKLKDIERLYGLCLKTGTFQDSEFKWIRDRFLELAGRPIRTLEQVEADAKTERTKDE